VSGEVEGAGIERADMTPSRTGEVGLAEGAGLVTMIPGAMLVATFDSSSG
jgi:hypothetical protein